MVTFNLDKRPAGLLLILVCLMVRPAYSQPQEGPWRTPAEAKQRMKELYAAVQPDYRGRLGVVEYDPELLAKTLEALDQPEIDVRDALLLIRWI